jgi:hypothetical protein
MMIPSLDLGIVILTNGWPVGLPEAVANEFAEIAEHGRVLTDWLPITRDAFAYVNTAPFAIDGQKRPQEPKPARDLAQYAGTYVNDYLGTVTVKQQGDHLVVRVGPGGATKLRLRHWSGDRFFYNEVAMPRGFWEPVTFSDFDPQGPAATIDVGGVNSGLGVMQRQSP